MHEFTLHHLVLVAHRSNIVSVMEEDDYLLNTTDKLYQQHKCRTITTPTDGKYTILKINALACWLYGWSEKNQQREGLGADDKNGIWVCLRCLEECPHLKVFMAVGEEKGCIGSNHADMSFFADSLYVLEPDCKGGEEIHTNLKGIPCANPDFEQALLEADSSKATGRCESGNLFTFHSSFSITPGKGSDIFALTLNGIGVSCANIPAGYHLPHKDDEFTVVAELEHTLAFIRHFVTTEADASPTPTRPIPNRW